MGGKVSTYFSPAELVYFHGLCVLSSLMEKMLYGSLQFFSWATAHITGSHKRQEAEYGKGMGPLVNGGDCGDSQQLCIILNIPRIHKGRKTRMNKLLETEFSLFLSLDLEYCAAMASFLWHRNHCRWDIIFSTPD